MTVRLNSQFLKTFFLVKSFQTFKNTPDDKRFFALCGVRPKALPLDTTNFLKKVRSKILFLHYPSLRRRRTACRLSLLLKKVDENFCFVLFLNNSLESQHPVKQLERIVLHRCNLNTQLLSYLFECNIIQELVLFMPQHVCRNQQFVPDLHTLKLL